MGETGEAIPRARLAHEAVDLSLNGFARLVGAGERRTFAAGTDLMHQGDTAGCMFVILSGRVSVVRHHPHLSSPIVVATLGAGETVGEMGLLDGEPRSATVTAVEDTVTVEIPGDAVRDCVANDPQLYASFGRVLSKRLRAMNDLAAEAPCP